MKNTYNEMIKDIRQMCAKVGVTFKRADHNRNEMAAYVFVSSATGLCIHNGSFNLASAYENVVAGNVDDWAKMDNDNTRELEAWKAHRGLRK